MKGRLRSIMAKFHRVFERVPVTPPTTRPPEEAEADLAILRRDAAEVARGRGRILNEFKSLERLLRT